VLIPDVVFMFAFLSLPVSFVLMLSCLLIVQLFMVQTGFYRIVSKTESERQRSVFEEEQRLRQRMAQLNIKIPDTTVGGAEKPKDS
jgi:ABC-type transport system involved in cytochrome bd biosynthesis fused ATPase/permease subunit